MDKDNYDELVSFGEVRHRVSLPEVLSYRHYTQRCGDVDAISPMTFWTRNVDLWVLSAARQPPLIGGDRYSGCTPRTGWWRIAYNRTVNQYNQQGASEGSTSSVMALHFFLVGGGRFQMPRNINVLILYLFNLIPSQFPPHHHHRRRLWTQAKCLISWRWSLPLPTNPVWWGSLHAISSYRSNRPIPPDRLSVRPPHTHRQDRLQYTAPQL